MSVVCQWLNSIEWLEFDSPTDRVWIMFSRMSLVIDSSRYSRHNYKLFIDYRFSDICTYVFRFKVIVQRPFFYLRNSEFYRIGWKIYSINDWVNLYLIVSKRSWLKLWLNRELGIVLSCLDYASTFPMQLSGKKNDLM